MKNYIGAVFFDFDGTLVDEREKIFLPTEATKASIETLQSNGYMVGLATGRSKCYIPETGIDFDCFVTSNGAYAAVDDKIVVNEVINTADIIELFEFFRKNNMGFMTENQKQCFYSTTCYTQFEEMIETFNISMNNFSPMPESAASVRANKLMFTYDDEESLKKLRDKFSEKFHITMHRHDPSGDLGIKGVSKAVGIQKVISEFNLDIADTYAFGDGENDYEMLSTVGHAVVMGHHSAKLSSIASLITDTVINEGVTKALEKLKLI